MYKGPNCATVCILVLARYALGGHACQRVSRDASCSCFGLWTQETAPPSTTHVTCPPVFPVNLPGVVFRLVQLELELVHDWSAVTAKLLSAPGNALKGELCEELEKKEEVKSTVKQ